MTVKVEYQNSGRVLVIKQIVAWWIRLIGVPFLIFGLYILSIFLYSIYHYLVEDASVKQWLHAIFGMLLTLLFALLFFGPGALFVLGRLGQRIECDLSLRKIIIYSSLLPWVKGEESRFEDYHMLKVEYVDRRSKSGNRAAGSTTHHYFELNLYSTENKALHLVTFLDSEEELAIDLARKIGMLFLIYVDDNPWEEDS